MSQVTKGTAESFFVEEDAAGNGHILNPSSGSKLGDCDYNLQTPGLTTVQLNKVGEAGWTITRIQSIQLSTARRNEGETGLIGPRRLLVQLLFWIEGDPLS